MTNDELTDAAVKQFNEELGSLGYKKFSRDEFLGMGNVEMSLLDFKVLCDRMERFRNVVKEAKCQILNQLPLAAFRTLDTVNEE